ncbi:MAG: hypothetical protein HOP33_13855 [Verrucomicrobia bacterium]|nr:hypothetical protein [Verrucomicrobiota bacterium]
MSLTLRPGKSLEPAFYSKDVRAIIDTVATMLSRLEIDPSRILADIPTLLKDFESNPKMVSAQAVKNYLQKLEAGKAPHLPEPDDASSVQNTVSMRNVGLEFDGSHSYQYGDKYFFSDRFHEWWGRQLRKRLGKNKAFVEQNGKGWTLSFSFDVQEKRKKPEVFGPQLPRTRLGDPPHMRGWYIALPSFPLKYPDLKAYVPLMRQFLEQIVLILEREGMDAKRIKDETELLLKEFTKQRGMFEYDDLDDYIEAEEKKERDRAKDSAKSLKDDPDIAARLKNLRRKYELKFGVAFDATAKQRRGKGWMTDYVVVDLTVAMPSKNGKIPDDVYRDATEVFKLAEKTLNRSRAYFCLRFVPDLKRRPWSVAMLLTSRDWADTHSLIKQAATDCVALTLENSTFKKQYANYTHALCSYSHRNKCLIAFPSEVAITFGDHFSDCDNVERVLLTGGCDRNIHCMSGVYLGNLNYFLQRHREAIPHWQRAADAGEPEALMCIGSAFAMLGDMTQAFRFCKLALQKGVPSKLLDDPDFAVFRRHPLFAKLKTVREAKPAKLAKPLSPKWNMPQNLKELVEENEGMWEDERWKPILLTVMSGVSNRGRRIPLYWQLEFDPYARAFKAAGKQMKECGIEPDGGAWAELIEREFKQRYPKLAREFDSDSETSTCVVSVKSEGACKKLLELVWSMIYPK